MNERDTLLSEIKNIIIGPDKQIVSFGELIKGCGKKGKGVPEEGEIEEEVYGVVNKMMAKELFTYDTEVGEGNAIERVERLDVKRDPRGMYIDDFLNN